MVGAGGSVYVDLNSIEFMYTSADECQFLADVYGSGGNYVETDLFFMKKESDIWSIESESMYAQFYDPSAGYSSETAQLVSGFTEDELAMLGYR